MSTYKCKHCGKNIDKSSKFCPECGKSISASASNHPTGKAVNNHLIMIAVLIVTAAVFSGYQLMNTGDKEVVQSQTGSMGGGMDMASMANDLPEDFESLISMGNAMMDQGQYPMAIVCYQKAIDIDSGAVDALVDMATCQHATGENETAIENFIKVLNVKPDHQVAKFNLGIVYYSVGQDDLARQWWTKLLSENPPEELKLRTMELLQKLGGS
ncbi:MAG: tetratricopeptide repeat protein [candidate division Zixibacteria bacterium]|nr:tetratricopeptide repeat protein [candidate division Zixibacteria bacterium]